MAGLRWWADEDLGDAGRRRRGNLGTYGIGVRRSRAGAGPFGVGAASFIGDQRCGGWARRCDAGKEEPFCSPTGWRSWWLAPGDAECLLMPVLFGGCRRAARGGDRGDVRAAGGVASPADDAAGAHGAIRN